MPAAGVSAPSGHPDPPRVVILGGGFAGLYAARRLRRAPVRVTVIDRSNHHLFQPLLYQVATASLSPADIAQPIRWILRGQRNTEVLLAEVASIDTSRRTVRLSDGDEIPYDWLIVATGATHSYFGHDAWAAHAPGLKTVADAIEIRERFLLAFEAAEREPDPLLRRAILTFVVVGGGPTGVELAGAMAEIARRALPRDFRRIDTTTARIILIEAGPRLLAALPEALGRRAKEDLERMGVDVWVGARVTGIDAGGVSIGDERIATRNVFWAAGVRASPLGASLGVPLDRAGRVEVGPDLTIPGHPEVFVVGDMAHVVEADTGMEVPGVAPAAMQMGRYAAGIIAREVAIPPGAARPARPAFRYRDKGNLATIGRARAVGLIKGRRLTGLPAWVLWLAVHITYLLGYRNRLAVLVQWAWAYVRWIRRARLITGEGVAEMAALRRPVTTAAAGAASEPAATLRR
jgi:NADH dehydrogenase